MKILLAEDEPDIQFVTRLALEDAGHEVVLADDGMAALEHAQAELFDVILLDVMMPRLDGLAVCHKLKTDPQLCHMPVIFLTARSQQYEVEAGLQMGAVGYIVKPFDMFGLSREINAILAQHGSS